MKPLGTEGYCIYSELNDVCADKLEAKSRKIKRVDFMVKFLAFNGIDPTKVFCECYFNMKLQEKS